MSKIFKILRISHIFTPDLAGLIIDRISGFRELSFDEQTTQLANLNIDNCEALSRELRSFGHKVYDVYFDLEIPQKKWAMENDVSYEESGWVNQILLKQIETIRPDILFFQKTTQLPRSVLDTLKKRFPFIRKVVLHTAYLGNLGDLGYADLLLVGTPSLVQRFQREGYRPRLFYHYFDPSIFEKIQKESLEFNWDVTFLGSSGFGGGYLHADRYETLKFLMGKIDIEMWLSEYHVFPNSMNLKAKVRAFGKKGLKSLSDKILFLISRSRFISKSIAILANECLRESEFHRAGRALPSIPLRDLFPNRCHSAVMGFEYYRVMAQSRISFTKGCDNIFDGKSSKKGNIGALRLFEATGLGSCLVADTGPNMSELFEEGKEIITYTTKEDAVEKIKYLLDNKEKISEIAEAGKQRTFRCHLAKNRAQEFNDIINSD